MSDRNLMIRSGSADRSAARVFCGWIVLFLTSLPLPGEPSAKARTHPGVDAARLDAAVEKGSRYLLAAAQTLPVRGAGPVEKPNSDLWHDELILYTLIQAGTDRSHIVFQKLLERALREPLTRTYRVSLTAMALQALGDKGCLPRIVDCAQFLVDNQSENGQWSYGEPSPLSKKAGTPVAPSKIVAPVAEPDGASAPASPAPLQVTGGGATKARKRTQVVQRRKGPPTGDNSNSQYAALGLRACVESGVDVPVDVLRRAKDWWEQQQNEDGGWNYGGKTPPSPSFGSMTTGGVGCLALYKFFLREPLKGDPHIAAGLRWMDQNFTVRENPRDDPNLWDRQYYYLHALERVGMLVGVDAIGKHDWYAEGANYLLEKQEAEGMWHGERPTHNEIMDTCYAILFLLRATQPLPRVFTR